MTGCITPLRRRTRLRVVEPAPEPARAEPPRTPEALFPPPEDETPPIGPARGAALGVVLGAILWTLIAALAWLAWRVPSDLGG